MIDHDRLIDDAAREMTVAPSRVDLRARVVEEIRAGGEANASYRWWLAAAAGILLAVYLGWPERPPVEPSTPPAVAQAPTQTAPIQVAAPPTPDHVLTPTRARRATAARAPEPTIVSIPALDVPEAIGIAPLDARERAVPALDAVAPLEIEDLDIKPLTPPGQAAGGH